MKKIFTLICALTAVFTTAGAQDVVFTYGGEALEEGAEVTVQAEDWTDMGMGYMADSNNPKVLELKNTGAGSANVSVTVKVIAGEYADIMWCGITTQCQKMASVSETRSTTLAAGATARLNIDTEFAEGEFGTRSVLITATANGESTSMTFHMENKATVVATKTYTDNLIVTINEESTEPMEANITLDEMSDGTYTLSLKDFMLVAGEEKLPVGNITLPGVTLTEGQGCKEFATKQIIVIEPGDDASVGEDGWLGPMLGEVPIDMQGQVTAEKLYCTIDIDMMASLGQIIKVIFGEELTGIAATVVATKTYTDNLIVTINEESTEPMEANITLDEMSDGTYTLSLKDFMLVAGEEKLPVGNITLPGVTLTEGQGCKEFATKQIIVIEPGDDASVGEDGWLGPMLGEVPIDMQGQVTAEKLYCTIDIDMMASLGQIIKVIFGEELTGIAAVQGNAARVNVYGIDGRIVRSNVSAADALNGLPRGIYVVGGKKVLK